MRRLLDAAVETSKQPSDAKMAEVAVGIWRAFRDHYDRPRPMGLRLAFPNLSYQGSILTYRSSHSNLQQRLRSQWWPDGWTWCGGKTARFSCREGAVVPIELATCTDNKLSEPVSLGPVDCWAGASEAP
jgi:hypothetical protein